MAEKTIADHNELVVNIDDSPLTNDEKRSKPKFLKWLLVLFAFFIVGIVSLFLVLYLTLRSGSLAQFAVPELKPYLEPLGIKLEKVGSLKLDLLRSVELHGLVLHWQDPNLGEVDLSVGHFQFDYALSDLWDRKVDIKQLLLEDVSIKAEIRQIAVSAPPITEATSPIDFLAIEKLLKSPPILLNIRDISFRNIQLDIYVEQPDSSLQYQGDLSQAALSLVWEERQLSGAMNVVFAPDIEKNRIIFANETNHHTISVSASPDITVKLNWRLENENDHWRLTKTNINFNMTLNNINVVEGSGEEQKILAVIDSLDLALENEIFNTDTKGPQAKKGLNNLFPVTLKSELSSNLESLTLTDFQQDDLHLSGKINHQITVALNGKINPLSQKIPVVAVKISELLEVSDFKLRMPQQKIAFDQFDWRLASTGETTNKPKKQNQLMLSVNVDAKMAAFKLDKPESKLGDPGIELTLDPAFHLQGTANLTSLEKPIEQLTEQLTAKLQPTIILNNLLAIIKEKKHKRTYKLAKTQIDIDVNYAKKQIELSSEISLDKVDAPELKKSFSMKNSSRLATNLGFNTANLASTLVLDGHELLRVKLDVENQETFFNLTHDITIKAKKNLKSYHEAAKELDIIGVPYVFLTGKTKIRHAAKDIQNADFNRLDQWPIETQGVLRLIQDKGPVVENGIVLSGPVSLKYAIDNKKNYQVDFDLNVSGIRTPPLERTLPVRLQSQSNISWPLSVAQSKNKIDIAGERAFEIDLWLRNKKENLAFKSRLLLNANPDWYVYLKDLKELDKIGALQTNITLNAQINHPFTSVFDFDPKELKKISAAVQWDSEFTQTKEKPGSLVVLSKAAKINQQLHWTADQVTWQSQIKLPELLLPTIVALNNIDTTIDLTTNSGLAPTRAKLNVQVEKGNVLLLSTEEDVADREIGQVVTPMSLELAANWTDAQVMLEQLVLNLGNDLLAVQAAGNASLDGKNAQIKSTISSQLRDNLSVSPAVSGSGSLQVPLRITLLGGKQVAVEGEMKFDHLNLSIDDIRVEAVNGSFNWEEELLLLDDRAKFRYLLSANPFQRVDFSRIQPYLNTSSISIQKISNGPITIGPILLGLYLKQNIFSLQQFDVDLFSGHTAGQFYLDVRPNAWKLGLLSRTTHLDPRALLAQGSQLKNSELSPINSRIAIEFDIHRRLMEGEVIVSQISRVQLLQLLDVIDPNHEDEQMAQLRKGLRFSHPQLLEVKMQRGLMNLRVEISGLPKAIRVTGLPLTPMIQQFASGALSDIDKIPLY